MVNPWILVPLYIYPLTTTTWKPLYDAISANPSVTFRVIVNPASGPGGIAGTYPDANYITGIKKLNGYANTELLGYVDTAYAIRSYKEAVSDVDAYTAWSKYTKGDIHMDGIFFDDNPNTDDVTFLSYLTNITAYTRKKMGTKAHISLNPGTVVSDKWYNMADSIVAFEDYYRNFKDTTANTVSTQKKKDKSIFIVHDFPASGSAADQAALVNKIHKTGKIAASFVTTYSNYDSWSSKVADYAKAVAAVGAGTTTTTTPTTSAAKKGTGKSGKRDADEAFEAEESVEVVADLEARDPVPEPKINIKSQTSTATGTKTKSHHTRPTNKPTAKPKSKTSKPTTTKTVTKTKATGSPTNTKKVDGDKPAGPTVTPTATNHKRWHPRSFFEAAAELIAV